MLDLLKQYLANWVLFLFDQSLNTLRGGDPGESISVAAAKARLENKKWGCVLCDLLAWILRTDHCTKALNNFGKHSLWGD
jgi:hypothetical protein